MSKAPYSSLYLLVFFLFLLSFPVAIIAQTLPNKIAFEKYGVAEGLPEEFARDFIQDDQGFIWIGTQNGLAKYDGYNFKVFQEILDSLGPTQLPIRQISSLLKGTDAKIWIAKWDEGFMSFDPKTERFKNYKPDPLKPTQLPYKDNLMLFEDVVGNIWFTSFNSDSTVLARLSTKDQTIKGYPHNVRRFSNSIVQNFQMAEVRKDSSLWLNSTDGSELLRYDRKKDSFEIIFRKGDLIPGTNRRDSIQDLVPGGKSGLLLMGNNRHLYLWDPLQRKVVESYDFPLRDNVQWLGAVFEDDHGNIWNTSYRNVTIINREEPDRIEYEFGEGLLAFEGAPKNVRSIVPEYQNKNFILFEIGSNEAPFRSYMKYDFKTETFVFFDSQFNDAKNQFVQNGAPKNFLFDKTGLLWIATRPNLYKQAPKTRQINSYRHDPGDNGSIHNDSIVVLFQDSKSRLWVGTRNGISLKGSDNTFDQKYSGRTTTVENSLGQIIAIYEDTGGGIWVTTWSKGLFKWDEKANLFRSIPLVENPNLTTNIIQDAKGNIWVTIWNQGIYVLDPDTAKVIRKYEDENEASHLLTDRRIWQIFMDSRDQIWLGNPRDDDQGLFRYVEERDQFKHYSADIQDTLTLNSNEIRVIAQDDLGRMWVGTDGGLNLYDHEGDYFLRNNDRFSLPSISSYVQGYNGKMWFSAYSGDGLALVGPGVNEVEIFDEKKGLLHNDILNRNQMPIDDLGKLWLSTDRGLSVFDTLNRTFSSYYKEDGYQKYEAVNAHLKTKNGDIWLGGTEGLNHIVPGALAVKDSTLPSMVITRMGIMDSLYSAADGGLFKKAVPYTENVTLNHAQRDLRFEFVALHYLRPKDNLYSWKLENYDTDWSVPSKERKASYTNLSPGTYTFRVKGSNADGIWNEEGASISITINPPWWLTWWAYTLYGLVLLYAGYRVHLYQRARTLKKARENAQKIELQQAKEIKKAYAELKATQSQLIQAEKMASLGELTAGIAHEIQNPLNFVNNFSELNTELIEELEEEMESGNLDEVKELAKDIKENEKKINHHGKRADSIVKGMLQHSRSSNGEKEPVDINVLADEYLRLAYHGLRAKDKTFNATMETNFDKKIGKISVVPQDIGRVVLNLITNAFHAVQDKKKKGNVQYEPTVTVITKKIGNTVEISVKDNGQGIPKKIIKKIFQPFFTTKASGRGTGLGLSMSYEIVTKGHGGTLTVESEEGQGTEFKINLPA